MIDLYKMRKKTFIVQKFILFLVVIRMYTYELPLYAFVGVIILLIFYKQKRQGNTPIFAFTLLAFASIVLGQYFHNSFLYILGPIFAGISHFLAPNLYWFPPVKKLVGFRQTVVQNNLYMMQLYPLNNEQNTEQIKQRKFIKWNHKLQLKRMAEHDGYDKNLILFKVFSFFISAIDKTKLMFGQGQEIKPNNKSSKYNTAIVFSHGRTATPMMYSQILLQFAQRDFNVLAVQHTEKTDTKLQQISQIKKFRQKQVQMRAAQMYSSILECKQKKHIILMGHSYGGATVIQTYHSLDSQTKNKVKCLILLDPWLFPLTEQKFKQQFKCPVLVIACQYFLQNEDIYKRNKQFVEIHQKNKDFVYLCWKRGDHLHFTDFGFVLGNIFGKVKHSEQSLQILEKNMELIDLFLEGEHSQKNIQEKFKQQICQKNYKPAKFTNYLKY